MGTQKQKKESWRQLKFGNVKSSKRSEDNSNTVNMTKPYRITDLERKDVKGICAASLEEILLKARTCFDIGCDPIRVVLEEDGTEILGDDYFQTLDFNTKLMILKNSETYPPANKPFAFVDEIDNISRVYRDPDPISTIKMLVNNPASIALISEEELEVVAEAESLDAGDFADISSKDLLYLQNACADQLENKQKLKNALAYIDLMEKVDQQIEQ